MLPNEVHEIERSGWYESTYGQMRDGLCSYLLESKQCTRSILKGHLGTMMLKLSQSTKPNHLRGTSTSLNKFSTFGGKVFAGGWNTLTHVFYASTNSIQSSCCNIQTAMASSCACQKKTHTDVCVIHEWLTTGQDKHKPWAASLSIQFWQIESKLKLHRASDCQSQLLRYRRCCKPPNHCQPKLQQWAP